MTFHCEFTVEKIKIYCWIAAGGGGGVFFSFLYIQKYSP